MYQLIKKFAKCYSSRLSSEFKASLRTEPLCKCNLLLESGLTPQYLLRRGPYRLSRNPMYAGEAVVWLGWALFYGRLAIWAGLAIPVRRLRGDRAVGGAAAPGPLRRRLPGLPGGSASLGAALRAAGQARCRGIDQPRLDTG